MTIEARKPAIEIIAQSSSWNPGDSDMGKYIDDSTAPDGHDGTTTDIYCGFADFGWLELAPLTVFNIPSGATISWVSLFITTMKMGNPPCKADGAIWINGTQYNHGTDITPQKDSYRTDQWDFTQNPETSSAWLYDDVNGTGSNAIEGFGVNSIDASPLLFVTQIYIEVEYTGGGPVEELLAGQSNGLSTAGIPAMTAIRGFVGSSAGVAIVTNLPLIENTLLVGASDGGSSAGIPTIKCLLNIAGASDGVGVTANIPAMKAIRELLGASDGVSTSGILTMKCALDLGGASEGLSTIGIPAMISTRKLAGASDGACIVANIPEIKVSINVAGQSDGLSTAGIAVKVSKTFIGLSGGVGAHSPPLDLKITKELIGDSDGLSTVAATVKCSLDIGGTTDGLSTVSATVSTAAVINLAGASNGVTTVTNIPTLKLVREFTSSISCTSVVADVLIKTNCPFDGTSEGTSTVVAVAKITSKLTGAAAGLSTAVATLKAALDVAGASDGTSTTTATVKCSMELVGTAGGISTAGANVKVTSTLAGASVGLSTAVASLIEATLLVGASDGLSIVTGIVKILSPLVGSSAGTSTASATVEVPGEGEVTLAGASDGTSTTGANTKVTTTLIGISDGLATDLDTKLPKLAEEAMYAYILHAIISTRAGQQEYLVQRLKRDKSSKLRNAKIRLSNVKLDEIVQVMRGKSKWIKN